MAQRRRPPQASPASARRAGDPEPGWAAGIPYTIYFPDGRSLRAADIEYPAALPRIGDTVDYLDESGASHRYRVRDVVHTLQSSPSGRASVREGTTTPNSLAASDPQSAEAPGAGGSLSAGLPEVFLEPIEPAPRAGVSGRTRSPRSPGAPPASRR